MLLMLVGCSLCVYIGPEKASIELSAVFVEDLFDEKEGFFVVGGGNGLMVGPC